MRQSVWPINSGKEPKYETHNTNLNIASAGMLNIQSALTKKHNSHNCAGQFKFDILYKRYWFEKCPFLFLAPRLGPLLSVGHRAFRISNPSLWGDITVKG